MQLCTSPMPMQVMQLHSQQTGWVPCTSSLSESTCYLHQSDLYPQWGMWSVAQVSCVNWYTCRAGSPSSKFTTQTMQGPTLYAFAMQTMQRPTLHAQSGEHIYIPSYMTCTQTPSSQVQVQTLKGPEPDFSNYACHACCCIFILSPIAQLSPSNLCDVPGQLWHRFDPNQCFWPQISIFVGVHFFHTVIGGWTNYLTPYPRIPVCPPLGFYVILTWSNLCTYLPRHYNAPQARWVGCSHPCAMHGEPWPTHHTILHTICYIPGPIFHFLPTSLFFRSYNLPPDQSYDLSPDLSPDPSPDQSPDWSPDLSPKHWFLLSTYLGHLIVLLSYCSSTYCSVSLTHIS